MAENKEKPILVITEGEQAGQRWTIDSEVFSIGRGGECELILPERQVSRVHIRIFRDGDDYVLEDLDSKNGTWVNNNQIKATTTPLHDGDEINVAMAVKMTFVGSEATAPLILGKKTAHMPGGRLQLDRDARRVFINNRELDPPLSLPQYRLLELLFDGVGGVRTREEVVSFVWPEAASEGVSEQAIDALVRRLRDRLNEIDPDHQYIVTVRGHGFRLENPEL